MNIDKTPELSLHEVNNYNVRIPGTPPTYEELIDENGPKFHNRKARLKDHIVNLKEQWIGYPHALYYMSVKIASVSYTHLRAHET